MLGAPYADHEFFEENTVKVIKQSTPPEERWAAMKAIQGYMADLITAKEEHPPDDLLGRQIVKLREDGTYRRTALAGMGLLLLVAGHETTANMISLPTMAFLSNPEQLAMIKADPGKHSTQSRRCCDTSRSSTWRRPRAAAYGDSNSSSRSKTRRTTFARTSSG